MHPSLIIASTPIRQDAEGRYCLNDLHKAAGDERRHEPANWKNTEQYSELVAELETTGIPVVSIPGRNGGTFVAKELVYAYAMWISAAFHLKVIRAYDEMVSAPKFTIPQTLPEALRLAADLADQNKMLQAQNDAMLPKVDALDRIANADGSQCMTAAAKALQVRPKDLFKWLQEHQWIYRRAGGSGWLAYQHRIQCGLMEHKVTTVERSDGSVKMVEQALITANGLATLSERMGEKLAA
jgi:phage antirepressor YoqD-like protein